MAVTRRAAFDLGSGASKLLIADVDPASGKVLRVLFAKEVPVKYALDWKTHGRLSDEIALVGLEVLRELRGECVRHGVVAYAAIATEVFRKAPNGTAFLARVESELGLRALLVTQDEEAALGLRTAAALSARPSHEIIAWDSGGASFQISNAPDGFAAELRVYAGALGASVATALMIEEIQGSSLHSRPSPNPVTVDEADRLVGALRARLPPVPAWLLGSPCVSCIGGPNSLFNVAALVARTEGLGSEPGAAEAAEAALADADGFAPGPRPLRLARAHVRSALLSRCGESDAILSALGFCEVPLLVPKLCLLLAAMEHLQLGEIEYLPAIGSCAGVLASADFQPLPTETQRCVLPRGTRRCARRVRARGAREAGGCCEPMTTTYVGHIAADETIKNNPILRLRRGEGGGGDSLRCARVARDCACAHPPVRMHPHEAHLALFTSALCFGQHDAQNDADASKGGKRMIAKFCFVEELRQRGCTVGPDGPNVQIS